MVGKGVTLEVLGEEEELGELPVVRDGADGIGAGLSGASVAELGEVEEDVGVAAPELDGRGMGQGVPA